MAVGAAGVHVQAQVLETVDAVVDFHVADVLGGSGTVMHEFKRRHGVDGGVVVVLVEPVGVAVILGVSLIPLHEAAEVLVVNLSVGLDGLGGVVVASLSHGAAVVAGPVVGGEHGLTVDVEFQVVFQQAGSQVEAGGVALEV